MERFEVFYGGESFWQSLASNVQTHVEQEIRATASVGQL